MKKNKKRADKHGKFNPIVRFFIELKEPSKKCERLGHKEVTTTRRIRRKSSKFRAVVADSKAEFGRCTRCGKTSEPQNEHVIDYYSSCSMPKRMWDEIEDKGYCVLN